VVLAQYLPMAVLYDPATLDLGDASVADRLRKQAKTRAVKVLSLSCSLSHPATKVACLACAVEGTWWGEERGSTRCSPVMTNSGITVPRLQCPRPQHEDTDYTYCTGA